MQQKAHLSVVLHARLHQQRRRARVAEHQGARIHDRAVSVPDLRRQARAASARVQGAARRLHARSRIVRARGTRPSIAAIEFYITDSWINIHQRGHQAGAHTHNNSLLSGVLYLKVNEHSGDLVFQRDVQSLVPFPPALDLDMDFFNLYNCKSWAHKPKTNDICLFPSTVMHAADPNHSDEERWCLRVQRLRARQHRRVAQAASLDDGSRCASSSKTTRACSC